MDQRDSELFVGTIWRIFPRIQDKQYGSFADPRPFSWFASDVDRALEILHDAVHLLQMGFSPKHFRRRTLHRTNRIVNRWLMKLPWAERLTMEREVYATHWILGQHFIKAQVEMGANDTIPEFFRGMKKVREDIAWQDASFNHDRELIKEILSDGNAIHAAYNSERVKGFAALLLPLIEQGLLVGLREFKETQNEACTSVVRLAKGRRLYDLPQCRYRFCSLPVLSLCTNQKYQVLGYWD